MVMKRWSLVCCLFCSLLLTGCAVRLLYNWLDWAISWKMDDYFSLSRQQSRLPDRFRHLSRRPARPHHPRLCRSGNRRRPPRHGRRRLGDQGAGASRPRRHRRLGLARRQGAGDNGQALHLGLLRPAERYQPAHRAQLLQRLLGWRARCAGGGELFPRAVRRDHCRLAL